MLLALFPCVLAGPVVLTTYDRLARSDGTWHDSKADEIPFQVGCGFRPEEFFLEIVPGKKSLSFCDRSTADYSEVAPLTGFFNALNGNNWRDKSGWLSGHPCFDFWNGVECNVFAKVTKIVLPDNKVRGVIPASIAQLTSLRELHLNNIMHDFHMYTNEHLNIISGALPDLSALTELQVLELNNNEIVSLPDFRNNKKLEILSVNRNRVTAFPMVEGLDTIRILQLADNLIAQAFPGEVVCTLTKLKYFNVGGNKFTGTFPACLADLNPVVFDMTNRGTETGGMRGEFPEAIIQNWVDIASGYLSLYFHFPMRGRVAAACVDVRLCYKYMYATHGDLTWVDTVQDVPDLVFETMSKATRR